MQIFGILAISTIFRWLTVTCGSAKVDIRNLLKLIDTRGNLDNHCGSSQSSLILTEYSVHINPL